MTIRTLALCVLLSVLLASVPAQGARKPLPVAVSQNASNVLRVEDGRLVGVAAPLYRCVFERTGLEFSFIEMPLARALFSYEHGEVAAVVPLAQSEERDRYGTFAGPLIDVQYVLLSLQELPSFKAIEGMVYVVPRAHLGRQFVSDFVLGGFEVNSWDQVFSMLRLGRADFTVVPRVILNELLEDPGASFYTLPAGVVPSSLYISDAYVDGDLDQRLIRSVATCRAVFEEDIRQKQEMSGAAADAADSR